MATNLIKYLEKTNYGSDLAKSLGRDFIKLIGFTDEQIRVLNLPTIDYISSDEPFIQKIKDARKYNSFFTDSDGVSGKIDDKIMEFFKKFCNRKLTKEQYDWFLETSEREIVLNLDKKVMQELREELRKEKLVSSTSK